MSRWRPDGLLKAILFYIVLGTVFIWLPLNRGLLDGPTYEWGLVALGGAGLGGDYWVLPLLFLLNGSVLYLGWRGARRPFHWLLLLLLLINAAQSTLLAVAGPEDLVLQGDTLGAKFPIGKALLTADLLFLALGILWVWRDLRSRSDRYPIPWIRRNRRLLTIYFALIPVQFVLLRFGEPHGTTDQIGVVLTIAQLILLNAAWYPWNLRRYG